MKAIRNLRNPITFVESELVIFARRGFRDESKTYRRGFRDSPTQLSRHTTVRQEIHGIQLNAIREDLTSNDITQHVKHDLQKILAWFIIDYFSHNIHLIAQTRKKFRPQNADDETVLAEQTDYVWDPEWSHESFIIIPTDISNQAISTISIHKDYVRVYPLTIDATPLNYHLFLPERTGNNSLNSTFINHDNIYGTRNLTTQDIQTPSQFVSEESHNNHLIEQARKIFRPQSTVD